MSDKFLEKKMKYVKLLLTIGIILIVLNILLSYLSIQIPEFWQIMLNCWGAIFLVMGIARYCLYKNKNTLKYYKITETDERNNIIMGKAGYLSFVVSIIGLAALSVVLVYLDHILPVYLTLSLLLIEYLVFIVLSWHYNKTL